MHRIFQVLAVVLLGVAAFSLYRQDTDLAFETGVLINSLRVLGQTDSFGFVSNSQSFFPVSASYPRIQPSPWA